MTTNKEDLTEKKKRFNRLKINFEFTRLSVLLFRIQSFEKAKKIALFELNGTSIQTTILSEINYFEVISKIKGLKIIDLVSNSIYGRHNSIFGIGIQTENDIQNLKNEMHEIKQMLVKLLDK